MSYKGITWIGHASFRIEDDVVVYIDPWKVKNAVPADIILVTHGHRDHLSLDDIKRLSKPGTVIVAPASCVDQLEGDVRAISVGEKMVVKDVKIEAVASYNTDKPNHPQSAGNVGYVVTVGGTRIYHAGDTDLIPEMAFIEADVALLPMGGTYTMDAEQAAEAMKRIGAPTTIPMHWGDIVGTEKDVDTLRKLAPQGMTVLVMDAEND